MNIALGVIKGNWEGFSRISEDMDRLLANANQIICTRNLSIWEGFVSMGSWNQFP